jgi:hypothetical protein
MNDEHNPNGQNQKEESLHGQDQQADGGGAKIPPTHKTMMSSDEPLEPFEKSPDGKKWIELPGANRLLSAVAAAYGAAMAVPKEVFNVNGGVYYFSSGEFHPLSAAAFRTFSEKYITGFKIKDEIIVAYSISSEDATGILASEQFLQALPLVVRVNACRLPVYRENGKIELLSVGHDEVSQTFTMPDGPDYPTVMSLDEAVQTVRDLLEEFKFTDPTRSVSVTVAGMVGLYVGSMLPLTTLKPGTIIIANAEGAGKTMLAKCIGTPVLGKMPTGIKCRSEEEVEKRITTAVREARQLMLLDNCKGYFDSPSIEALLSSETWSGRQLGQSVSIVGPNILTIIITGNGLTVSPDLRRRCLFLELVLDVELAEQRKFKRTLDDKALKKLRRKLLAALWALVKNWDEKGRPKPSGSHSAFPTWAELVGGIVEAAGFTGCFDTPNTSAVVDTDGDDMRRLTSAMTPGPEYSFNELLRLAAKHGCFERIIGATSDFEEGMAQVQKLSKSESSRLGILLSRRYNGRQIGNVRFVVKGDGHARRFQVVTLTAS